MGRGAPINGDYQMKRMTGEEMRVIRVTSRVTQEQLAKQLGVKRGQISNWERGVYNIPARVEEFMTSLEQSGVIEDTRRRVASTESYWLNDPARKALEEVGFLSTADLLVRLKLPHDYWRSEKIEKETGIIPTLLSGIGKGCKMWPPGTLEKLRAKVEKERAPVDQTQPREDENMLSRIERLERLVLRLYTELGMNA